MALSMPRQMPGIIRWAALAAAIWALLCACNRGDNLSGLDDGRKLLTYALGNDVSNMDPALITDIESALVASQVYEGLVRFKVDSTEVEPALAESYESTTDGLSWTFKLRKGIQFQDGTPLNADAVIFSIMRQWDSKHPYHVPGKMRYAKFMFGDPVTTESELLRDIIAPDDHTIIFTLARPHTPFLKNLALTPASIVSPAAVKTYNRDFNTTMVGTGPFRIKSYRRDEAVSLQKSDSYWGDPAKLDEVRFRILRDANVRMNSIRKGESDVISGVEPTAVDLLKQEKNVQVLSEPSMNLGYLALNNKHAPLDNPKVRLALAYAIDRSYIVDSLFAGSSVEAKTIVPPGMLGHDQSRPGFPYDPAKAKALLDEAGYPNGFTVTFLTHDRPRIYNPVGVKLAERIQQDLSKINVTAKIEQMEFSSFLDRMKSHDFQIANGGWVSDNGDPDNFIYELAGREDNELQYDNPAATAVMRKAAMESDEQRRAELYYQAETMLAENPPFIAINHAKQTLAVRDRVENLKLHPTGVTILRNVDVKQ